MYSDLVMKYQNIPRINDLQWHDFLLNRDGNKLTVELNDQVVFSSGNLDISPLMGLDFVFLGGYGE